MTAKKPVPAEDGAPVYTPLEVTRAVRRLDMSLAEMHLGVSGRMDMTAAELLAIAHIGMEGPLGPTELAHRLHLRTGAVTALLDRLAARDYIAREPHPSDRRKLIVRLTGTGRDDTMAVLGTMVDDVVAYVKTLPREDQQTVGRFIDGLVTVIAAGRAEAPSD